MNSSHRQQQGTKQDLVSLHCTALTAGLAAQPHGGGFAVEMKAASPPRHGDGNERKGSRESRPWAPWAGRARGWGGSTRSPSTPRGCCPGLLRVHCPSGRTARLELDGIILPSQPPSPKPWRCRGGREERGAGFVYLAQSYALKQVTENAAEGGSKAEFGTDKSRGRPSPVSDASHVFVFPFPILAFL